MVIIGCDFHPGFQQIAMVDTEGGEVRRLRLAHKQQAEQFYRSLRGREVLVGMESCGYTQWFEQLLGELGLGYRIGDAAQIRASYVRKQKTDKRDAGHILRLLVEDRFPALKWLPTAAERDVRQLIVHRHKRVQMETRVKNQLHALAINQGLRMRWKLWSKEGRQQLQALPLLPYAAARRADLLQQLDQMEEEVERLDGTVRREAEARPEAVRLMSHPGVGPVTALAYVLTLGDVRRFEHARQVASYLGLIPSEHSSGGKQRLGHISKQGNSLLRFLLVEAGHSAVRKDAELARCYARLKHRHSTGVAKVAVARKLALRLYWMLRSQIDYAQLRGPRAGKPVSFPGGQTRPAL
ncbi:MAG TPA: IS110 family transposase [Terracidiphilus sp.]|nr:IS110 family transposase [Terracidiphilus sp.]